MRRVAGNLEIESRVRADTKLDLEQVLAMSDGWRLPNANEMELFQWMCDNGIGKISGLNIWYKTKIGFPDWKVFARDGSYQPKFIITVILVRDVK